MIFVTVGNAKQPFTRLLDGVTQCAASGVFRDEPVVIQSGHAAGFVSDRCRVRAFLSRDEFISHINDASLVICHGGVVQLDIIKAGKVPVVMPRRCVYGEHVNDHQLELVQALSAAGRVIPAFEPAGLPNAIAAARAAAWRPVPRTPILDMVEQALSDVLGPPWQPNRGGAPEEVR